MYNSGVRGRGGGTGGSAVMSNRWFSLLLGGHVSHQVTHTVAVGELVVVPGQEEAKTK